MSYYTPDIVDYTNAPGSYGVPKDYSGVVGAGSFLKEFIKKELLEPERLGDPRQQEYFERWVEQQSPEGRLRLDPTKLDLREFRNPTVPVDPGEFLERDRFLLSPRGPLAQTIPF